MWNKIFNVQNPFWQSMGTIFDLFILNSLWLLCCIPLVTIGPATTAVWYALIQRARKEDISVSKDFFHSFKTNLRQGILLGVPLTLVGAFLALDIYMCRKSGTGIYTFFMVFFSILFLFWMIIVLYAFPLLAKFDRKNSQILIWAFTLSLNNLSMTLTMLFVIIASLWIIHIIPGLVFIMPGMAAQFCATIFASILKPYLPKPFWMENSEEGDDSRTPSWETAANSPAVSGNDEPGCPGFDESAFYGEDPEEVKRLLEEYENDSEQNHE